MGRGGEGSRGSGHSRGGGRSSVPNFLLAIIVIVAGLIAARQFAMHKSRYVVSR